MRGHTSASALRRRRSPQQRRPNSAFLVLPAVAAVLYFCILLTSHRAVERLDERSAWMSESAFRRRSPEGSAAKTWSEDRCSRYWDWPSLDEWEEKFRPAVRGDDGKRRLAISRSGAYNAEGKTELAVHTVRTPVESALVRVSQDDALSGNVWHRFAAQYMAWLALQLVRRRYGAPPEDAAVVFGLPCSSGDGPGSDSWSDFLGLPIDPIPQGWSDLGNATCWTDDGPLYTTMDMIVDAPRDGLLWDLAWDEHFDCRPSDMFRTFVGNYLNATGMSTDVGKQLEKTRGQPLGCIIGRRGSSERYVLNYKEVLAMMRGIFADVRQIDVKARHKTADIVGMFRDCSVIFGVHGAGFVNSLFARPTAVVVELLPFGRPKPMYYRNINMLVGHHYIGIQTNGKMADRFLTVDIDAAEAALQRALKHAVSTPS